MAAALVAGAQYELVSDPKVIQNKKIVFVKLTDSASRAIENYLEDERYIAQKPTIEFSAYGGSLNFPKNRSFKFNLTTADDIAGRQGDFECVQQTGPRTLDKLGSIPLKMRVQANDDIYQTTKSRMQAVEESNKTKIARVISASNSNSVKQVVNKQNVKRSSSSSKSLSSSKSKSSSSNSKPDVVHKPLKKRLIMLLALRPQKKPEILDRLNREGGIRQMEQKAVSVVLRQIAQFKDNAYYLQPKFWNEVDYDWPFFTDEERGVLKRKRPENITPPSDSNTSSASGESPNSLQPGSPKTIPGPNYEQMYGKRPGYFQGSDGFPTKKRRIARVPKAQDNSENSSRLSYDSMDEKDEVPKTVNSWKGNSSVLTDKSTNVTSLNSTNNNKDLDDADVRKKTYNGSANVSVNNGSAKSESRSHHSKKYKSSKHRTSNSNSHTVVDSTSVRKVLSSHTSASAFDIKHDSVKFEQNEDFIPGTSKVASDGLPIKLGADYLTRYVTITNAEQKRRYKEEYNSCIEEYAVLYEETKKASINFKVLETELEVAKQNGNQQEINAKQLEIVEKYEATKDRKAQFSYLHSKLSHMKKLIEEYDGKCPSDSNFEFKHVSSKQ